MAMLKWIGLTDFGFARIVVCEPDVAAPGSIDRHRCKHTKTAVEGKRVEPIGTICKFIMRGKDFDELTRISAVPDSRSAPLVRPYQRTETAADVINR